MAVLPGKNRDSRKRAEPRRLGPAHRTSSVSRTQNVRPAGR